MPRPRLDRRAALRVGAIAAVWLLASGHTPYRQWQVYRRKHLLIGTSRADPPSYPLGQRIVDVLTTYLPESSARVARGPDAWRLASLLTSGQMEVILLTADEIRALRAGRAPFEAFGPTEVQALYALGDHWLIARPDFPPRHAYLVVQTLVEHGAALPGPGLADPGSSPAPFHPGALAYGRGEELPPLEQVATGRPDEAALRD